MPRLIAVERRLGEQSDSRRVLAKGRTGIRKIPTTVELNDVGRPDMLCKPGNRVVSPLWNVCNDALTTACPMFHIMGRVVAEAISCGVKVVGSVFKSHDGIVNGGCIYSETPH